MRLAVGITGATGAIYGIRLLQILLLQVSRNSARMFLQSGKRITTQL